MSEIGNVIQMTQERFTAIAPQWMKYDAEKGFAIQVLKNNPYLEKVADGHPTSLQQAITNVAAIGLSLNPAEKLAYLIARNVKVDTKKWETRIFLEPSYMGLCRLATDSGSIEWIQAQVVRENDEFIDNGPGEKPTHTYNAFKDRGEVVGVYCVAKTIKGDYLTETMPMDHIISIRDRSEAWKAYKDGKAKTGGPWQTDFEQQAKKTVIRRAFKMWPRTDERRMARLNEAVHLSNENEGFEPLVTTPNYAQYTATQKSYFDQLIEEGDALGMYCFMESFGHDASSADAAVKVALWHSFPKGQKGRFQRVIESLCESGKNQFVDIQNTIIDAIQRDDDLSVKEHIAELSDDVITMLKDSLSGDHLGAFNDMTKQ